VLKKLSLKANKMEHVSNSVKHVVPMLKKDDLNEYISWSDKSQGVLLTPDCSVAINWKKMQEVLSSFKKHDDLSGLDLNDA